MRRSLLVAIGLLILATVLAAPAAVADGDTFPKIIPLPNGWRPEGIASGRGTSFYVGSLANGAIYAGDFRTGQGEVLVPGQPGRVAVGVYVDQRTNYLFVSGGGTGQGGVYDASTGTQLATYEFTGPGSFINDVVTTREAAYFTNSRQPVLYKVPLGAGGELPAPSSVQAISLGGDWQQVPGNNANGIEATSDGRWLVIVNSTSGKLYRVDPQTGQAVAIDLGGAELTAGDGLRFAGSHLYVVRNRLNQIAVVNLNNDLTSGTVERYITDPAFRVPTTIASFGASLYAVNAHFGTPSPETAEYEAVKVPRN